MKFTAIDLRTDECQRIFFEMSLGELINGNRNMTIIGISEYQERIVTNISDLSDIQVVDYNTNMPQMYRE